MNDALGEQHYYGWTPSPPDDRDHLFAAPAGVCRPRRSTAA